MELHFDLDDIYYQDLCLQFPTLAVSCLKIDGSRLPCVCVCVCVNVKKSKLNCWNIWESVTAEIKYGQIYNRPQNCVDTLDVVLIQIERSRVFFI